MASDTSRRNISEDDCIRSVQWRFRICNYLFRLGSVWIAIGAIGVSVVADWNGARVDATMVAVVLVGMGIFSAASVLTLAIYRCPVCDKYLSRFRPCKQFRPSCGAKVWASNQSPLAKDRD
jgi:hypothetical protein